MTFDIPTLVTAVISGLVTLAGGVIAIRSSLFGEMREMLNITNAELNRTRQELRECRDENARLQHQIIRLGGRPNLPTKPNDEEK